MQNLENNRGEIWQLAQIPRRKLLQGVAISATGIAGTALLHHPLLVLAHPHIASRTMRIPTPVQDILHIARTTERLAVTFYTYGLTHAAELGLTSNAANSIRMMLVEEQLHEFFFRDNGGQPLTSLFSFPYGPATFTHLTCFIETQQQLENIFHATYLTAVREFAKQQQPYLAQMARQLATTEHRVSGQTLFNRTYFVRRAVTPVQTVADVPILMTKIGYLSPHPGNAYPFVPVGITYP